MNGLPGLRSKTSTTSLLLTEEGGDLLAEATKFAERTTRLLAECLPQAPPIEVTYTGSRARLAPIGQTEKAGGIPLLATGEHLAWLRLDFLCRLNSSAEFLAIDKSKTWVVAEVDKTPIFRFEYLYDAEWVPHSHIQIHAERGALAHLLSRTNHPRPHSLSALHLPTGGARFRPGLEDVIQFLLEDCRFDKLPTWRDAVMRERQEWRRIQTRTVTRAWPEEAVAQLRKMGYVVDLPQGEPIPPSAKTLGAW